MSLGQRVRRSWLLCVALVSAPVLLASMGNGRIRSLVTPGRLSASDTRPSTDASYRSVVQSPRGRFDETGRTEHSAGQPASGGRSQEFSISRRDFDLTNGSPGSGEDDVHPTWSADGLSILWSSTHNVQPPPSTFSKIPPMMMMGATTGATTTGATTTGATTTGSTTTGSTTTGTPTTGGAMMPMPLTLDKVPQYSVYMQDFQPRLRSATTTGGTTGGTTTGGTMSPFLPTVRMLTKTTGNQFYPSLDNQNRYLLYVASPEAQYAPPAAAAGTGSTAQQATPTTGGTTGGMMMGTLLAPAALPWTLQMIDVNTINFDDPMSAAIPLKIRVNGVQNVERPVWSPDGRAFIFAGQSSSGHWSLYYGVLTDAIRMGWDAMNQPQPIILPLNIPADPNNPDALDPVWSPDGLWVAFTRGKVLLHGLKDGEMAGTAAPGRAVDDVSLVTNPMRAYIEYQNTHVWVAPVRGLVAPVNPNQRPTVPNPNAPITTSLFNVTLGRPRQITQFSVIRAGQNTPVSSIEYLPSWTPGLGLSFTTNRLDRNGDRIPDDVGTSTSIFVILNGTEVEAAAAPIILNRPGALVVDYSRGRNLARKETFSVPAPENHNESYSGFNPTAPYPAEFNDDLVFQMDVDPAARSGTVAPPLDSTYPINDIWETFGGAAPGQPLSDNTFDLKGLPIVTPRLAQPGAPIKIEVNVAPSAGSGINVAEVSAVVRDPDLKLFGGSALPVGTGNSQTLATSVQAAGQIVTQTDGITIPISLETGAQAIDIIPLYDDGPAGGHGDSVAGDGIFTGVWTTPTVSRDYLMDIAVRGDRVFSNSGPLGGGFAFDYFDNVWGFSTKRFQQHTNLLLVSDRMQGQTFLTSRTGQPVQNRGYTLYPVESYYMSRPHPLQTIEDMPKPVYTWPGLGAAWSVLGLDSPYGDDFDLWRTQCRDSFQTTPPGGDAAFYANQSLKDAIAQYLPHQVQGFSTSGAPKLQKISDRAIVWASPYTGDFTTGSDHLTNPSIQLLLTDYLSKGGRMMLSGQDVGWALTQNGNQPNRLLNSFFHVQYLDDGDQDILFGFINWAGDRHILNGSTNPTIIARNTFGAEVDPVSQEPFGNHWVGPDGAQKPPTTLELTGPFGAVMPPFATMDTKYDGAWNQALIDGVTAFNGTGVSGGSTGQAAGIPPLQAGVPPGVPKEQYTFATALPYPIQTNATQRDAAYVYQDATTGFRTAFLSFGLEGIHRHYESITLPGNRIIAYSTNRPAQVMHNAVCWLRQGAVSGTVYDIFLGRPIPGAVVQAYYPVVVNGIEQVGQIFGGATTDADGNYTIQGLDAAVYHITVNKPGFLFQHGLGVYVHGGQTASFINLALQRVPPGNIQGSVVDSAGKPVPGLRIEARLVKEAFGSPPATVTNGPLYIATADDQGRFFISGAEAGVYDVEAKVNDNVIALTGDIHVSSNATASAQLIVSAALHTQVVSGHVLDSDGKPVSSAQVVATGTTGDVARVQTDQSGAYSVALGPGTYVLKVITGAGTVASTPVVVGSAPVSADLVLGQVVNPGPTSQISLPAGLSLISLPSSLNGVSFASLFGAQTFRVAAWNGTSYAVTPDPAAAASQTGQGYFVRLASPVTVTVPTPDAVNMGTQQIALKAGWNLIGDPFTLSVPNGTLQVMANGAQYSLPEAEANGLIGTAVWTLSGGDYAKAASLDPGKGYWLFAQGPATLLVPAPPTSAGALGAAAATLHTRETADVRPWGTQLQRVQRWIRSLIASPGRER